MDDKALDARVEAVYGMMHPKMKNLLVERVMKAHVQEFMDEMVRQGRAEHDAATDSYRMIREEFPPGDLKAFLRQKTESEG
jgi:hypothetical protein